jgi:hypothetical protein
MNFVGGAMRAGAAVRAAPSALVALALGGCGGNGPVATATPPSITVQPAGVAVVAPVAATFSVGDGGSTA